MVTLDGRDRLIVQHVARFKQLSSRHIYDLLFSGSRTPCDRALRRLTEQKYLARIERRIVGGSGGGSGQYVYQLGRRGFYLHFSGRYEPRRAVDYHALAIADCFVRLRQLEWGGKIRLVGFSTEPDCWMVIAGRELKPDMYVDVEAGSKRLKLWFEVDMGTEAQRQLRGKLEAYWRAYDSYTEEDLAKMPTFPRVVWLAVDEEREKELRWLIEHLHKEAQKLFTVTTQEKLYTALS